MVGKNNVATVEPKTHGVLGKLHLVLSAATGPRTDPGTMMAAYGFSPTILAEAKRLARADLSGVEDAAQLERLLKQYREMSDMLERILELSRTRRRIRILELLGTPDQIESVLETLEEKIEDLEIASSPEVHAAIEQLITEATSR